MCVLGVLWSLGKGPLKVCYSDSVTLDWGIGICMCKYVYMCAECV